MVAVVCCADRVSGETRLIVSSLAADVSAASAAAAGREVEGAMFVLSSLWLVLLLMLLLPPLEVWFAGTPAADPASFFVTVTATGTDLALAVADPPPASFTSSSDEHTPFPSTLPPPAGPRRFSPPPGPPCLPDESAAVEVLGMADMFTPTAVGVGGNGWAAAVAAVGGFPFALAAAPAEVQAPTPKELAVVVVDMPEAVADAGGATVDAAEMPREALGLFGCAPSEGGVCDTAGGKSGEAAARTALCGVFPTAVSDIVVVVAVGGLGLKILLVFQPWG